LEDELGASVTILDSYEGSIVVVFEVSTDDISLEQMVNMFANDKIKFSYPILDVYSETSNYEINIVRDGKLTYAV
jgi:hypothetical protein